MKTSIAAIGVLLAISIAGCNSEANKPEDSMASTLMKAKADQGITGTDVKSKNDEISSTKKAPPKTAPTPAGSDTGVSK